MEISVTLDLMYRERKRNMFYIKETNNEVIKYEVELDIERLKELKRRNNREM